MDVAAPPTSAHEDDFELVPSQNQDHDDLSSITSAAGETDNESDNGGHESQAASNVTLRMPQVSESCEYMTEVADDSEEGDVPVFTKVIPCVPYHFDLKPDEVVVLPILYLGSTDHIDEILNTIAAALYGSFTPDVWTSTTYSIMATSSEAAAECRENSRLCLRLETDAEAFSDSDRPFLVVTILNPDGTRDSSESAVFYQRQIDDAGFYADVPCISLIDSSACESWDHSGAETESRIKMTSKADIRLRSLTISDFGSIELDEDKQERLARGLLKCLDIWSAGHLSSEAPKQSSNEADSHTRRVSSSMIKAVPWLLMLLTLFVQGSWWMLRSSSNLAPPHNQSNSAITFHQVTETNALIELPFIYRSRPVQQLPKVTAAVARDGKQIKSRLRLVVDNLYSLDWAQTEAHGELVVTAQMAARETTLEDAYVIQYSAKSPLLNTIIDRMHDLQGIGHLPEVDLSRRLHELVRQVEESRSYAVNISQHQLRYIKESGSHGLQKLSESYPEALRATSESLKLAMYKGVAVGESVKKQSLKQLVNAEKGYTKLKHLLSRQKRPLIKKHSHVMRWANHVLDGFQTRKK